MLYIKRTYDRIDYDKRDQVNPNIAVFNGLRFTGLNYIFMSDDSEWKKTAATNGELEKRTQDEVISHQYVLKYPGYPLIGYIIYRDNNDKPFSFWDMLSVIKQYINDIGYHDNYSATEIKRYSRLLKLPIEKTKQRLFSHRIPPILITTFFGGVDVTAYRDWYKYLDSSNFKGINDANPIVLYKNAMFSRQFAVQITSPDRHRRVPILLQYRDMMPLAPEGGLEKLGNIVGQSKIDTIKWDIEDGKQNGYYKRHMRELRKKRYNDYRNYAMNDAEIILKYLGFFMRQEIKIYQAGLIDRLYIPTTLMGLSDKLTEHYLKGTPYDNEQVAKLVNNIFGENGIDNYLRPLSYNQQPPKKQINQWQQLIQSLSNLKREKVVRRHRIVISKLISFLGRHTISYFYNRNGNADEILKTKGLMNKINFKKLYELNPNLVPSDLLNKKKKIHHYYPNLKINNQVEINFQANAYRFKRNNSNEIPTISNIVNYIWDKSVFATYLDKDGNKIMIKGVNYDHWLTQKLDFAFMRTGYRFLEASNYSNKHEKGIHDITTLRPDSTYNQGFDMARQAYIGGQNQCYNPGIIQLPFIYDIDEKSSYVMAGHLIPDVRLDCPALIDKTDFGLIDFKKQIFPKLINGVFTLGTCDVDYSLPKGIKRAPIGIKAAIKNAAPRFVMEHKRAKLSLTDVISLIEHRATVYFHRLIVPVQKKLDNSVDSLYPSGRAQDWTLYQRNLAKKRYGKESPEQEFFKLLGNAIYGKTGQGLNKRVSKDFVTNRSYLIPVSQSTNPLVAMQYTSIARYQVNFLMDLLDRLYPHSVIPSVTTDGFIWAGHEPLDKENINCAIRECAPKQWVQASDVYFSGQFFEFKSKIANDQHDCSRNTVLINLRTRFNFTLDGRIKALAGIRNVSIQCLYKDLINNVVVFRASQHRISNFKDMKHKVDYKHLLSEWNQSLYQMLSYDDSNKIIDFHDNGDGYGYYITRPFKTVEEAETYKANMKPYRMLFPFFNSKYAWCFLGLNNNVIKLHTKYIIFWIKEDVPLRSTNYLKLVEKYNNDYRWKVLLRYLAKHDQELNIKDIYQDIFKGKYKSLSGFKQAIRRSRNKFVNPFVIMKEKWNERLKKYII